MKIEIWGCEEETHFIRVGEHVIALDAIATAFGLSEDNPTILLSFTDGRQQGFAGVDAIAMRAFFAENAIDITREQ